MIEFFILNKLIFKYTKSRVPLFYKLLLVIGIITIFIAYDKTLYLLLLVLLYASIVDFMIYEIPNVTHVIILLYFFLSNNFTIDSIIGSLIITIPLYLIYKLKSGIGFGDIKLFFCLGLLVGTIAIINIFIISTITLCIFGIYHYIFKKDNMLAYGPHIIFAFCYFIKTAINYNLV